MLSMISLKAEAIVSQFSGKFYIGLHVQFQAIGSGKDALQRNRYLGSGALSGKMLDLELLNISWREVFFYF